MNTILHACCDVPFGVSTQTRNFCAGCGKTRNEVLRENWRFLYSRYRNSPCNIIAEPERAKVARAVDQAPEYRPVCRVGAVEFRSRIRPEGGVSYRFYLGTDYLVGTRDDAARMLRWLRTFPQ